MLMPHRRFTLVTPRHPRAGTLACADATGGWAVWWSQIFPTDDRPWMRRGISREYCDPDDKTDYVMYGDRHYNCYGEQQNTCSGSLQKCSTNPAKSRWYQYEYQGRQRAAPEASLCARLLNCRLVHALACAATIAMTATKTAHWHRLVAHSMQTTQSCARERSPRAYRAMPSLCHVLPYIFFHLFADMQVAGEHRDIDTNAAASKPVCGRINAH